MCLLASAFLASPSFASPSPHYVFRDVAFVTLVGRGSVRTVPTGIRCPGACRASFVRGTHLRFVPAAAPGWRFVAFRSKWCGTGSLPRCAFDLVSPHECDGGACPVGAFGVRVLFVRKVAR